MKIKTPNEQMRAERKRFLNKQKLKPVLCEKMKRKKRVEDLWNNGKGVVKNAMNFLKKILEADQNYARIAGWRKKKYKAKKTEELEKNLK